MFNLHIYCCVHIKRNDHIIGVIRHNSCFYTVQEDRGRALEMNLNSNILTLYYGILHIINYTCSIPFQKHYHQTCN